VQLKAYPYRCRSIPSSPGTACQRYWLWADSTADCLAIGIIYDLIMKGMAMPRAMSKMAKTMQQREQHF